MLLTAACASFFFSFVEQDFASVCNLFNVLAMKQVFLLQ